MKHKERNSERTLTAPTGRGITVSVLSHSDDAIKFRWKDVFHGAGCIFDLGGVSVDVSPGNARDDKMALRNDSRIVSKDMSRVFRSFDITKYR